MKIVFFGGGSFGITALLMLAKAHDIRHVFCPPPRPAGRKMHITSCPLAAAAREMLLPLTENHPTADEVRKYEPDAVVVCDYGVILPPDMLTVAARGALNIHPSLLPRWRGAAPIARAIMEGDSVIGVSIMQIDTGLDTGAILAQQQTPVPPDADYGTIREVLAEAGAELLLSVLNDNPPPVPQDSSLATYAHKIHKDERVLNFSQPAEILARQIRALSPPGARAWWGDSPLIVSAAQITNDKGAPGEVLSADEHGIVVGCGKDALRLLRLQKPGGQAMDAAALLRGRRQNHTESFCPPHRECMDMPR